MSSQSKLWYLENNQLLKGLSQKEMMNLEKNTVMKTASKDQYIYFPEEPSTSIYFLKEGRIKIGSYSDDGRENIKAILKPGEIFGELSLAGEEKRTDFAQAMDDNVVICTMSMKEMEGMMEKNAHLGIRVTKLIGFRLKRVERKIDDLIFKDAKTRILEFLIDMTKSIGKKVGDEILVKHYLTHQDIANLTASSRQTVTTVLNELKEKELIYFERKSFLIHDIEKIYEVYGLYK